MSLLLFLSIDFQRHVRRRSNNNERLRSEHLPPARRGLQEQDEEGATRSDVRRCHANPRGNLTNRSHPQSALAAVILT